MYRFVGMMLFMIGSASLALAQIKPPMPEIDPSSAGSALALLTGGLFVIRGLRKK